MFVDVSGATDDSLFCFNHRTTVHTTVQYPIEPPYTWAWGQHPNGLGYKVKNGLSLDQCIKNPVQANTLLCTNAVKEISYWQCFKNPGSGSEN